MKQTDLKAFVKYIKEHIIAWVLVFALCFGMFLILFKKWTAPTKQEQVNFAITAFAHHSEGKEDEFLSLVESSGIKEVNISFFDISNPQGMSEYLLTYGYHQSDIFILDTSLGQSVLQDCYYVFSKEQLNQLSTSLGFDLKYVYQGEDVIGILIHEKGNDDYNEHFSLINNWLLFSAEGLEFDYAIFLNANSSHNDYQNFVVLQYLINGGKLK